MPESFIDFQITGIDKIEKRLKELPTRIGDMGVEQANNYLINVLVRKEIPPYKYVSYKQAYGKPPPKGFFWRLKMGLIDVPYIRRRKGVGISGGWRIVGKGRRAIVSNNDPAAKWVYSELQARMMQLIGWKRVSQIIDIYEKRIVASFERGVKAALKKVGLV